MCAGVSVKIQTRTQPHAKAVEGHLNDLVTKVTRQWRESPATRAAEGARTSLAIKCDAIETMEDGPWVSRLLAAIKRNWISPPEAAVFRGHAAITFVLHKDGSIDDVRVTESSQVAGFTTAARNAIERSSGGVAMPSEGT